MEILKKTQQDTRLMQLVISHFRVFQLPGRSFGNNEETTDPVFIPEFRVFQMSGVPIKHRRNQSCFHAVNKKQRLRHGFLYLRVRFFCRYE